MLEKYFLKFKVEQIKNLKTGLEALNSTNKYRNYQKDKEKVMDYSFNFVMKLINGANDLTDAYKVYIEPKITGLGQEIIEDKQNVKKIDDKNAELDNIEPLNEAQKELYGSKELRNIVNEKVSERNELINEYKNPREALKNYLVEKFNEILYTNLDTSELADAIIDKDENYFNNHKEEIVNIDPLIFAEIYSDIYSEQYIDSTFDSLGELKVSEELNVYSITKVNKFDLVVGNLSDQDFESLKDSITEFNNNRNPSEEEKKIKDIAFTNFKMSGLIRTNYNDNARLLNAALTGLTPNDGDEYLNRIADVVGLFVKDSFHVRNVPLGVDRDSYENYEVITEYFKNIILNSSEFGGDGLLYTEGVDFNKIAEIAREKYQGLTLSDDEINRRTFELKVNSNRLRTDASIVYDALSNGGARAFDKLLNDCLDGKSDLHIFDNQEVPRTSDNISLATEYILKCYDIRFRILSNEIRLNENNEPILQKSLEESGISHEYIKNKSNSLLDPDYEAKNALRKFNDYLNLYNVNGEELQALNAPYSHQGEKALLRAQVITEGLNVSKDSPLLNDAISIYGHLKQVHESRGALYFLFHPIRNYRENQALAKMKETLMTKYDFTEAELNNRVNEVMENSVDPINKEFLKHTNHNKYLEVQNKEKENNKERDNILSTTIDNINKYGTLTVPKDQIPNTTLLNNRIVKDGILVDNVDLTEKKNEMSIDEFVVHLKAQDSLLDQINIKVEENARQQIINDAKIMEIEKYVDLDGYNKDYQEAISFALRERDIMLDEIKNGKNSKYDNEKKTIELKKNIHKLNTEERIDKYNEKLDEYNKSLDLKEIENAKDDEALAKAQKAFDENEKIRIQNAKDREAYKIQREKLYKEINDKLSEIQLKQEENELKDEYNKVFNSIDDSKRGNELSKDESSSIEKMNQKFGFDIEADTNINDTKSKDDFNLEIEEKEIEELNIKK